MNTKKILLGAFVVLIGLGLSSFTDKDDDRNFQVAKNLDIFNAIFKELDLFSRNLTCFMLIPSILKR